jgi:hypothetical protein
MDPARRLIAGVASSLIPAFPQTHSTIRPILTICSEERIPFQKMTFMNTSESETGSSTRQKTACPRDRRSALEVAKNVTFVLLIVNLMLVVPLTVNLGMNGFDAVIDITPRGSEIRRVTGAFRPCVVLWISAIGLSIGLRQLGKVPEDRHSPSVSETGNR